MLLLGSLAAYLRMAMHDDFQQFENKIHLSWLLCYTLTF